MRTRLISKSPSPNASINAPPVAVISAVIGSLSTTLAQLAPIFKVPFYTSTFNAENRTPAPNVEANARAANPSITAFTASRV